MSPGIKFVIRVRDGLPGMGDLMQFQVAGHLQNNFIDGKGCLYWLVDMPIGRILPLTSNWCWGLLHHKSEIIDCLPERDRIRPEGIVHVRYCGYMVYVRAVACGISTTTRIVLVVPSSAKVVTAV